MQHNPRFSPPDAYYIGDMDSDDGKPQKQGKFLEAVYAALADHLTPKNNDHCTLQVEIELDDDFALDTLNSHETGAATYAATASKLRTPEVRVSQLTADGGGPNDHCQYV